MKDREFLIWIHQRLVEVHGDRPLLDYMHRLRAIIAATPFDLETKPGCYNGIEDLPKDPRDG